MSDAVDLDQVRREIEAEVRAKRAAGVYPPGFERELDELFARFSPPAASGDFDAVLDQAEESATISPIIPTDSEKPAGVYVKKGLSKAVGWYHAWMAQQIVGFAGSTIRAVRILGRRVRAIESQLGDERVAVDALAGLAPRVWSDALVAATVDALRGAVGRVLVAESGTNELLRALVDAGVDAYGCEPRSELVLDARDVGLEVRAEPARSHLVAVPAGALGAVVLAGCIERGTPGNNIALLDLARRAVAPGGVMAVGSVSPASAHDDVVAVDLSLARPFHAPTWEHLLHDRGCTAESHVVDNEYLVVGRLSA